MIAPIHTDYEGVFPVYALSDIPMVLEDMGVSAEQISRVLSEMAHRANRVAGKGKLSSVAAIQDGWKASSFRNEIPGNAHVVTESYSDDAPCYRPRPAYCEDYTLVIRVLT
jgi:hypothetical protein